METTTWVWWTLFVAMVSFNLGVWLRVKLIRASLMNEAVSIEIVRQRATRMVKATAAVKGVSMSNTATINISSPDGSHKVFVQQDADNKRTINSSVDTVKHILNECSANSEGSAFTFNTDIHVPFWTFYGDKGTLAVDVASNTATLDIAQAGFHASGVLGAGEAAALVAFVKACGLPDLGS